MDNRTIAMEDIAMTVERLIRSYGRRNDIVVKYIKLNLENIKQFSDFQRKYHHLWPLGDEYFLIYEVSEDDRKNLLYTVNVSADSLLTAMAELVNLASKKF